MIGNYLGEFEILLVVVDFFNGKFTYDQSVGLGGEYAGIIEE
jgi:hypothetical protein